MGSQLFRTQVTNKHRFTALEQTAETNTIDILIDAANQIRHLATLIAPRDTGALRSSIAVVSTKGSDYSNMVANARRFRPGVSVLGRPSAGKNEVYVLPVVGYAGHQEFGTRNHGAQPFLIPALRTVGMKVLPQGFAAGVFGQYKQKPPIYIRMWF